MPVFNEEDYIAKTIQSIIDQNYYNWEMLIGDNASIDNTSSIIDEIIISSLNGKNIQYIRRKKNIGAIQNFNDLMMKATGEYIVVAGAHDLWSPNYLHTLINELEKDEDAVLAFAPTQWIDNNGEHIDRSTGFVNMVKMHSLGRFVSLLFSNQHYIHGVIRTEAIQNTHLQKEILGSGEILLQELAQQGTFICCNTERWYRRANRDTEERISQLIRYKKILFSSSWNRLRFSFFPHLLMFLYYLALPFYIRKVKIGSRVLLFLAYPLIIARFIRPVLFDIRYFGKW